MSHVVTLISEGRPPVVATRDDRGIQCPECESNCDICALEDANCNEGVFWCPCGCVFIRKLKERDEVGHWELRKVYSFADTVVARDEKEAVIYMAPLEEDAEVQKLMQRCKIRYVEIVNGYYCVSSQPFTTGEAIKKVKEREEVNNGNATSRIC